MLFKVILARGQGVNAFTLVHHQPKSHHQRSGANVFYLCLIIQCRNCTKINANLLIFLIGQEMQISLLLLKFETSLIFLDTVFQSVYCLRN